MKFKITLFMIICAMFITNAQMKKWTLQECVTFAIDNNLSVEQFQLDLETVKIEERDALGNLIPNLNGDARLTENLGLSFNPTSQEPVNTQLNFTGNLTSSLTLFDGLRNFKNLTRAKMNAIASQYRLDDLKDDIRLNVANAYLQVLSNKEALKVSEAQYAVTEQDLKRTKELVESGVSPRGDLLEIEATAASQEQQIVNGEGLVLISRINLAQLLQITDYENFDIADESFEIPPSDILNNSAKVIFDKALSFRNDIKFSKSNVELAEKDIEIAKGAYYPTLNAFINYNTRYSDQNLVSAQDLTVIPFTEQLYRFDGLSYGFQLNVPFFNGWNARNGVKRAKIDLERAKLQLEQDKLDLETNIQQAYVDVTTFSKAHEAAVKTLEARRLAYDYAKERFNVGLMNAFDFSQAQSRVDDAEATVIRTKYDYIFRLKILEFYFGIPISLN
ncbi:TolC family protein [Flagellimonas sp. CMM7]|uniref:TolC family protein n=1 Tax=Flagellimonas sp. CMM7 TaxID=2654676 RepID=UPI0013D1E0AF|nr:TolC family protein [Flagellimonas sp. CMM7]UII80839.1 TolC family protein [Flagellimonas sp. CMM7]